MLEYEISSKKLINNLCICYNLNETICTSIIIQFDLHIACLSVVDLRKVAIKPFAHFPCKCVY